MSVGLFVLLLGSSWRVELVQTSVDKAVCPFFWLGRELTWKVFNKTSKEKKGRHDRLLHLLDARLDIFDALHKAHIYRFCKVPGSLLDVFHGFIQLGSVAALLEKCFEVLHYQALALFFFSVDIDIELTSAGLV